MGGVKRARCWPREKQNKKEFLVPVARKASSVTGRSGAFGRRIPNSWTMKSPHNESERTLERDPAHETIYKHLTFPFFLSLYCMSVCIPLFAVIFVLNIHFVDLSSLLYTLTITE